MKTLNYLNLNENKVANVVAALQNLLADFQVYYTNLRGFHWEIKGRGFFVLHEKFESMYDDAAAKVDEIAERILTLGGTPENKFSGYLKAARIQEVSGVTSSREAVENILETYKQHLNKNANLSKVHHHLANQSWGHGHFSSPCNEFPNHHSRSQITSGD